MNVFEIIQESKLDEFKMPGDDAQAFISNQRLKELGFDKKQGAGLFRPYGNDNSEWTYSKDNIGKLMKEALSIYLEYMLDDKTLHKAYEKEIGKFLTIKASVDKENFRRVLIHSSNNSNPQITHAEALGMALNFLVLIARKIGPPEDN